MEPIISLENLTVSFLGRQVIRPVTIDIYPQMITSIMGPSGCGKSTVLKSINRLNELVPGSTTNGSVKYHGIEIYSKSIDPTNVRAIIGMVFQKPNPFPKSIYENIAFGPRIQGYNGNLSVIVEKALDDADLLDEVKDRLDKPAYSLSGGQQQRLCIARALAIEPEVILLDEPCSALDPIATTEIENLMRKIAKTKTVVLVTHNMQQAARVSDRVAFMYHDGQMGYLHHYGTPEDTFVNPKDKILEDFVRIKI